MRPAKWHRARRSAIPTFAAALLAACAAGEPRVAFETAGGEAWTFEKRLAIAATEDACEAVRVSSPLAAVTVPLEDGRARPGVPLAAGENRLRAECLAAGRALGAPAEQRWLVRLEDRPRARVRIVPTAAGVALDAGASEPAPARPTLLAAYEWRARDDNPAAIPGLPATGRRIELAAPTADGTYHVTLRVRDTAGRHDESTAVFRVRDGRATMVDLAREPPDWVRDAVVYGVVPHLFPGATLAGVTQRLDALAALGVTVLWLSPVTASPPDDFGYEVTDHFRLRESFGSEADLRRLVDAAHARGMRVIMDFVPNHASARHPYFLDTVEHGARSPYYDFFERGADGESRHYFDWPHLKNLNFGHPEVQRLVIEAFAHWVRAFDVDGFRVDVAWGPRLRAPEFWPRWRAELKRIKPDLLLLAEASALDPYYRRNGFDAAYDWTDKLGEWAWAGAFADETPSVPRLRAAIRRSTSDPEALVFRFLNNNDTGARFVTRHGPARTRVAAAMLLTLPGLPGLYAGDEVGAEYEPYDEGPPLAWDDPHGLGSWYATLTHLRRSEPALQGRDIGLLELAPADRVLAYVRPAAAPGRSLLILLNYGAEPVAVALPEDVRQALGDGVLVDLPSADRLRPGSVALTGYGVRIVARE